MPRGAAKATETRRRRPGDSRAAGPKRKVMIFPRPIFFSALSPLSSRLRVAFWARLAVILWAWLTIPCAAAEVDKVDFNREVRPILSTRCLRCHGPDEQARKAGLRLDVRDVATRKLKDDAIAIVPGKPTER